MPVTDIAVLVGLLVATPAAGRLLWRSGARGARFAGLTWIAFCGLVLVLTMTAHSLDILGRLYVGQGYDGKPWSYDFRVYALLLLGGLLIACGIALLRAAARLGNGDGAARLPALRTTLVVLAVVVPLLPIHRFFAAPITAIGLLTLLVLLRLRVEVPHTGAAGISLRPAASAWGIIRA